MKYFQDPLQYSFDNLPHDTIRDFRIFLVNHRWLFRKHRIIMTYSVFSFLRKPSFRTFQENTVCYLKKPLKVYLSRDTIYLL
jgi:hypothetical protein